MTTIPPTRTTRRFRTRRTRISEGARAGRKQSRRPPAPLKAISLVIPELKGKMRVRHARSTLTVPVGDLTYNTVTPITVESITAAVTAAAEGPMKDILGYTDEPLVSSDFKGDARSSIFDALSTIALGDKFAKVVSWYDNEWGYSTRVADLIVFRVKQGL